MKDSVIQTCILEEQADTSQIKDADLNAPDEKKPKIESVEIAGTSVIKQTEEEDIDKFYDKIMGEDEDENAEAIRKLEVLTFEIKPNMIEIIQKRCIEMDYPLLAEYDFRNDSFNPNLQIDLKPNTKLRSDILTTTVLLPFLDHIKS